MVKKRTTYPQKKLDTISQYQELVNSASAVYLINFKGTPVESIANFRKKLASGQSKLKVIKNRLAKIALKDTKASGLNQFLTNDNAIVLSGEDFVSTAKIISDEIKDTETINIVSGVLADNADQLLTKDDINKLSSLPSKETLITQLAYALNGPITKFARTLNEPISAFARSLSAIAQK